MSYERIKFAPSWIFIISFVTTWLFLCYSSYWSCFCRLNYPTSLANLTTCLGVMNRLTSPCNTLTLRVMFQSLPSTYFPDFMTLRCKDGAIEWGLLFWLSCFAEGDPRLILMSYVAYNAIDSPYSREYSLLEANMVVNYSELCPILNKQSRSTSGNIRNSLLFLFCFKFMRLLRFTFIIICYNLIVQSWYNNDFKI